MEAGVRSSADRALEARMAEVAIAGTGKTAVETLGEMLDQQGISYQHGDGGSNRRFSTILLADDDQASRALAANICARGGVVLEAGGIVDLVRIERLLSGQEENPQDRFNAFVEEQGEKLVDGLAKSAREQGLDLLQKWYWPDFAPAACVLTHDLDWLDYSPFHKAAMNTAGGVLRQPGLLYRKWFRGARYGWNVPETISAEAAAGFRSTFFLKTKYEPSEQQLLAETVKQLAGSGSEVALHASRASYRKEESLKEEVKEIARMVGRPPDGVRQHILKFQVPHTWKIQGAAGMKFDATFSYNEHFGFRSGTCLPYHPIAGSERLPIIELPTSFMDWTFIHRAYGKKEAGAALWRVAETVERHHGLLVVNFHNTYLDRAVFPDIWELYGALLSRLRSRGYWVGTASEVSTWWSQRAAASFGQRSADAETLGRGVGYLAHRDGRVERV